MVDRHASRTLGGPTVAQLSVSIWGRWPSISKQLFPVEEWSQPLSTETPRAKKPFVDQNTSSLLGILIIKWQPLFYYIKCLFLFHLFPKRHSSICELMVGQRSPKKSTNIIITYLVFFVFSPCIPSTCIHVHACATKGISTKVRYALGASLSTFLPKPNDMVWLTSSTWWSHFGVLPLLYAPLGRYWLVEWCQHQIGF